MNVRETICNGAGVERRVSPVSTLLRDPLTAMDRRVWLYLRDAGGYHTPQEARAALDLTISGGRPGPLSRLFNRCHVARREVRVRNTSGSGSQAAFAYGVTGACLPIDGESLEPGRVLS